MQLESIVFRDHLVRVTIWRLAYRITEGNYKTGGVARSSNATEFTYEIKENEFTKTLHLRFAIKIRVGQMENTEKPANRAETP